MNKKERNIESKLHFNIGLISFKNKDYYKSVYEFSRSIHFNNNNINAFLYKCKSLIKLNRFEQCILQWYIYLNLIK